MTDDEISQWLAAEFEAAMTRAIGGPTRMQPRTALRLRGRSLETVELDDAGNVIEPCACGKWSAIHRPSCRFSCAVT